MHRTLHRQAYFAAFSIYLNLNVRKDFDPGMVVKSVLYMTRGHYPTVYFARAIATRFQKHTTGENHKAITVEQNIFLFDRASS